MYSTRAFARLAGVTVKTLRHYEQRGLLVPKRTESRHRRYAVADLRCLERILALKSLALPLDAIKSILDRRPMPLAPHRQMLEVQRTRLERAIAALRAAENEATPIDALDSFIGEAAWDRWEAERRKRASPVPRAPDRAPESRIAAFRALEAALRDDPSGERTRQLAARYRGALDSDALGALKSRSKWPSGMRQYIASLYETTPEAFELVAAFIA